MGYKTEKMSSEAISYDFGTPFILSIAGIVVTILVPAIVILVFFFLKVNKIGMKITLYLALFLSRACYGMFIYSLGNYLSVDIIKFNGLRMFFVCLPFGFMAYFYAFGKNMDSKGLNRNMIPVYKNLLINLSFIM